MCDETPPPDSSCFFSRSFPMPPCPSLFLELLEDRIAPATLIGHNTVTYTDIDCDLVTLKTSAPIFTPQNVNIILGFSSGANAVNGSNAAHEQLQVINLVAVAAASGMNLVITAENSAGVSNSDGLANVGYIKAGNFSSGKIVSGVDLGVIQISGDLGRI